MHPVAQTVGNYGSQVAPANNLAIATIASSSLSAGRYWVEVTIAFGAVVGTADGFDLRAGVTTLFQLPIPAVINTLSPLPYRAAIEVDGSTALTVNAHGAGPVNSVYSALIIATRIRT